MKSVKKIISLLVLLLLVFASVGCYSKDNSAKKLSYGKKYIFTQVNKDNLDKTFNFVFNEDGTGVYTVFYQFKDDEKNNSDYKVTFKFLIIEDNIVCFFDSVKYGSKHGNFKVSTDWNIVFSFYSKDALISSGNNGNNIIYVCEDYLANIPNYGK